MKAKASLVLFVLVSFLVLGAAPPAQGVSNQYDRTIAARFLGIWESTNLPSPARVVIKDFSTYANVNATSFDPKTNSWKNYWGGKFYTRDGKMEGLGSMGQGLQEIIELEISASGHLIAQRGALRLRTLERLSGIIQEEYVKVNIPIEPIEPKEPIETVPTPPFCNIPGLGFLACDLAEKNPVQASEVDITCSPQCVETAHKKRPDLDVWASGAWTPDNILKIAQSGRPFPYHGQQMQVRVRDNAKELPQDKDLVIWPSGCQGAYSGGGHIGYNEANGGVSITDSNADGKCGSRNKVPITKTDYSCARFITAPFPVAISQPAPITSTDKCSQRSGFSWFLCKVFGW